MQAISPKEVRAYLKDVLRLELDDTEYEEHISKQEEQAQKELDSKNKLQTEKNITKSKEKYEAKRE
jgi:hypothetical protein